MGKRIVSGIVLIILAFAAILAGNFILWITLLLISLTAYRELMNATGVNAGKKYGILELTGHAVILIYYIVLYLCTAGQANTQKIFMVCVVLIGGFMALMAVYVFSFPKFHAEQVMSSYFCIIYAPVMLSFIYLTRNMTNGIYIVWMIFISSWICDTCAYFTGVTIGRHKLAPVLSPKKSIEGAIGGVLGSVIVGILFSCFLAERVFTDQTVTWIFAVTCGAGAVISQIGDLSASAIKRNHEIKDYGTCIPGHGGIMDRFDSVIFTAPIIYFMAVYLIGV